MTHTYSPTGTQTYTQTYGQTIGQTGSQSVGAQVQNHGHVQSHVHGQGTELHVLDDRDILTDLLLCAKQLLSAYGTATVESTNPQLRQTLKQISQTEAEFHTKTFELMQQKGWYETPRSDSQLAGQIASLWTQKMQRPEAQQSAGSGQHQSYQSHQQQSQPAYNQHAQPGSGQAQGWQHHRGDPWSQPAGTQWQTGQAAAKPWEGSRSSTGGPLPGAYT